MGLFRKKAKEQDVKNVVIETISELNAELRMELNQAADKMEKAERAFMQTLTDEQKQLFSEWMRLKQECQDIYMQSKL